MLQTDYGSEFKNSQFQSLLKECGRNEGNDITREDYPIGYALYAFNLSLHLAEEGYFNMSKQGTVRVELKFGAALPNIVTVGAYAEFLNVIEIDHNRNVIYDCWTWTLRIFLIIWIGIQNVVKYFI